MGLFEFQNFQKFSAAYLKGEIDAEEYYEQFYKQCDPNRKNPKKAAKLLTRLITFLPDPSKREALQTLSQEKKEKNF